MEVKFFFNVKFCLFQKVEKIHNKNVKFADENFEHLRFIVKFEVENFELKYNLK